MPIGNLGGHVPGSEELSHILSGMGVGPMQQNQGVGKAEMKSPVQRQAKDSVSRHEGGEKGPKFGLLGANDPELPLPNLEAEKNWRGFSIGGDIQKAIGSKTAEPIGETLGVIFHSEKIKQLAEAQPLARYSAATMGEEEFSKRLEAHFEAEGVTMPPSPKSPSYKAAISEVLEQYLVDTGSFLPDELTLQLEGGMDILKTLTDYSSYIQGIDAPEKSFNTGPGIQKTIDIMEENLTLVNTALEVLKEGELNVGDKISIADFMKEIAQILALVKKTLIESQLIDTKNASAKAEAEREVIRAKSKMLEERFYEQMSMLKIKGAMDQFNDVMRILMPCLSGVIILFSLFFLPFAPVVTIIVIAVALSMITLQLTLTETGAMEGMFDGLNSAVKSVATGIFGEDSSDLATFMIWLTIIISAIVIATLITVCPVVGIAVPAIMAPIIAWCVQYSGVGDRIGEFLTDWWGVEDDVGKALIRGMGSMIFSITTALCLSVAAILREILTQLIVEAVKIVMQLAFELCKIIIDIIGVLIELCLSLFECLDKITEAISQAISKVTETITKTLSKLIDVMINAFCKIMEIIVKLARALFDTIWSGVKMAIDKVVSILNKIVDALEKGVRELLESLVNILIDLATKLGSMALEAVIAVAKALLDVVMQLIMQIVNLVKSLTEILSKMLLDGMKQTIDLIAKIQKGGFKMFEARAVEIQGTMDVIIGMLGDLQKMLNESLNKVLSQTNEQGVGDFMEVVNQLTKFFENLISGYSDIGSGIARAAIV